MALLKGKLFSGLLFSGLLLGGQGEQVPVTPQVPQSGGMIARGIQYAQRPANHVKLSGNSWQEQDTYGYAGIKYGLLAQHKVFALGKTEQEQVSVGSITSTNLVNVYKTDRLVSAHYQANAETTQNQVSSSYANTRNAIAISDVTETGFGNIINSPILEDNSNSVVKDYLTTHASTYQEQQSFGSIKSKLANANIQIVSTHYHANAITEQVQESSGTLSTRNNIVEQQANNIVIVHAETYQQQASFGKVTTDDNEMLMVLMALMALDDEIA